MDGNVSLTQMCRICSTRFKHGVFIFGDEGKRICLQAKIRKYLYITISMDDKLPKVICENCCKKLESIHKFVTMAVKNQDKLNKMTFSTNTSSIEPKQTENKGLLHTYLTKGIVEKTNEDTEEMEVRVDPMLFLQYNSEEDQSEDESDNNNEDVRMDVEDDGDDEDVVDDEEENIEEVISEKLNSPRTGNDYECSMCLKSFHSEFALQRHIWSHNSKNRRIVLNSQNKLCTKHHDKNDESEAEHTDTNSNCDDNLSENGNGMKFACPICGKIISTKGNLKVHLETHRPKGKYGCDICGRIFKTQCNLHRHKEYHTGIQFTCSVCGRVYPTNSTLRAHSITHSDLRPHKCPLCDKTFKRNQDLKFHINQHTGARPYQCPYCPKAFASSGNCFSHRKRMHPMEVERDRERAAKIMR